jgi:C4-dicarboxylate-specific signal transduction histidine kinase
MGVRLNPKNSPHQDDDHHPESPEQLIDHLLLIARTALHADHAVWIQTVNPTSTDSNQLMIPVRDASGVEVAAMVLYRKDTEWSKEDLELIHSLQALAQSMHDFKLMQKDLTQHEQMIFNQSGLFTLGQISAEIIHEINNPLAALHAGLSLLKIRADQPEISMDYLKDILKKLLDTTDRINKIVYNIKKLSRKTENDSVEAVSIRELIENSIYYCQQRFHAKGVQYESAQVPTDMKVNCRMLQISQVLVNLMNNAMDAVTGTEHPWVKLTVDQDQNWVVIKVIDSGQGISEKLLNRLFEPFFTTKSENGGTGLGLSISRNLLEANGGMLEYAETDGHTTFVVKLPISVQQA